MDKKLYEKLKKSKKIGMIKCDEGCHFVECPECGNRMLQSWLTKKGPVALCYDCGTIFHFNHQVLKKCKGNPYQWEKQAKAVITRINTHSVEYRSNDLEGRRREYIRYVSSLAPVGSEFIEFVRTCPNCGEEMFTEGRFDWALLEFDSPERTFEILREVVGDHFLKELLETEGDYSPVDHGNKDWLIGNTRFTKEIREKLLDMVAGMYKVWLNALTIYDISHEDDPEWDCSGKLIPLRLIKLEKMLGFETVGEWLQKSYTGKSYPTYESGYGLHHETYLDILGKTLFNDDNKEDVNIFHDRMMEYILNMHVLEAYGR